MKRFCLVLLLFFLAALAQAAKLELRAPLAKVAKPRSLYTVGFTVLNRSGDQLPVDFLVKLPAGWLPLSSPQSRTLAPGEEMIVPITVQVPAQARADKLYPLTLVAVSGEGQFEAVAQVKVERKGGATFSFDGAASAITKESRARIPFQVVNTGNAKEKFWLRGRASQGIVLEPPREVVLNPGQIHNGMINLFVSEDAPIGSAWLELDLGLEGTMQILARQKLPLVVLSATKPGFLYPDLIGKLYLQFKLAEEGNITWEGNFLASSTIEQGRLGVKLNRDEQGQVGYCLDWKTKKWSLAVGDLYYTATSLLKPIDTRGLLFSVEEGGGVTQLLWQPGLFSYHKGGSTLVFTQVADRIWFYGKKDHYQPGLRLWGEAGLPLGGKLVSPEASYRVGGQRWKGSSSLSVDFLEAGAAAEGSFQDLQRLIVGGSASPFLFNSYQKRDNLQLDTHYQARHSLGLNYPLDYGNLLLRGAYAMESLAQTQEELGWELMLNKRISRSSFYMGISRLPLLPQRVHLRISWFGKTVSPWVSTVQLPNCLETSLGVSYQPGKTQWELEWQCRQENERTSSLRLAFYRPLALGNTLWVEGRTFSSSQAPLAWQLKVGLGVGFKVPFPLVETKGKLAGRVFVDRNGDGRYSEGELPLGRVRVFLNGDLVITDEDGNYSFPPQLAGEYVLSLAAEDLPVEVLPPAVALVSLDAGEVRSHNWPLLPGAGFEGKVQLLRNGAGSLAAIWLKLSQNGKVVARAITDQNGNFQFPLLPPGSYQLELEGDTKYKLVADLLITLAAGERKKVVVDLELWQKPIDDVFRAPQVQVSLPRD